MNQSKRIAHEMRASANMGRRLASVGDAAEKLLDGKHWMELTSEEKSVLASFVSAMRRLSAERIGTR